MKAASTAASLHRGDGRVDASWHHQSADDVAERDDQQRNADDEP